MPKISKICHKIIPVYTIPHTSSGDDSGSRRVDRQAKKDVTREIRIYPDPIYRPLPRPVKLPIPKVPRSLLDIDPEIDMDFTENSPFQEGVISESHQRPDMSYVQESVINTGRIVQKFLPKQADIDTILKIIQRKVLKGMNLSVTIKEIQAGYLISPYFKDSYLYLSQNKLHSTKTAICKVEMLAEKYILLDSLLFKLVITLEKETALLAIPEIHADKMIMLYHSSLFTGHQGVIKTYFTIGDKFSIPCLIHYI